MHHTLIECVPNFSEGRDTAAINKIAQSIDETPGVHLLDVDSGKSANRTVMTFVGSPDDILEAAFRAIATAADCIDMRMHHGTHPRIGATDVCPFIPLINASMEDCIKLSEELGARVASELDIPIFLYAESARSNDRRKLSQLRLGQYEGLQKRITDEGFLPDYPTRQFNKKSGATVIGARNLLIAYNVSLDTDSEDVAQEIALKIRQQRNKGARHLIDCAAIGWYAEEYNCAQVSLNLMNLQTASFHQSYLTVTELAKQFNVGVRSSEIIGMLPLRSLLETGRYHLHSMGLSTTASGRQLIDAAVDFLKLCQSQQQSFNPEKKIIEYELKSLGYGINTSGIALEQR
jgi:glutamate formiminotransferase/formiminotetrahydrofolate cyclodeaminase